MIEVDTEVALGSIGVATTNNSGHTPDFGHNVALIVFVVYQKMLHHIYDNKQKHIN